MQWQKMPIDKKLVYLSSQMEEIQRAKAVMDRFENVTQKWIMRLEAMQAGKTVEKTGRK